MKTEVEIKLLWSTLHAVDLKPLVGKYRGKLITRKFHVRCDNSATLSMSIPHVGKRFFFAISIRM